VYMFKSLSTILKLLSCLAVYAYLVSTRNSAPELTDS
jgi:uncharacterized protein YfaQ (DUF2300 family)